MAAVWVYSVKLPLESLQDSMHHKVESIKNTNGFFVIVSEFSFDDNLIIVPTLREAYDYIEMEDMERELKL